MNLKIAVVHYPHGPEAARLETMPFVLNSIFRLIEYDICIDLYLWETPNPNYRRLFSERVNIFYSSEPKSHRYLHYWVRFRKKPSLGYALIIGVGQIGAYIGSLLAQKDRCPFVYFNDEFPSALPLNIWSRMERKAAERAAVIVVPDDKRTKPLRDELNLKDCENKFAVLPNIPRVNYPLRVIDWHQRLGIPSCRYLFIHAGSIADWAQVPEILCTVPLWPKKTTLILHSRQAYISKYRRELSHLERVGQIVWSELPFPEDELNSLISYCHGCFALYRNTGPNIEYIGLSSGKLMRSIACGTPVIASSLKSLSFVRVHGLGKLVQHPIEIVSALREIIANESQYRNNCENYYKHFSFDSYWGRFIARLRVAGLSSL